MAWFSLILAGICEVGFTSCLSKAKTATGSEYYFWIIGFFLTLSLSMFLLFRATQTLPMGTAYAVWTGIGAVGTVLMGIFFFKEPIDFWRLFFIFLLIGSIIGLKTVSE